MVRIHQFYNSNRKNKNGEYNKKSIAIEIELVDSAKIMKRKLSEIANEVIAGKWGNNPDRKRRLESAGYDYNAVQKRVNQLMK